MRPRIDHLDITVKDLDREEVFYDALLPLLGFELTMKAKGDEPAYEYRAVDYSGAEFSLSLICPRPDFAEETVCRRRPGGETALTAAQLQPQLPGLGHQLPPAAPVIHGVLDDEYPAGLQPGDQVGLLSHTHMFPSFPVLRFSALCFSLS